MIKLIEIQDSGEALDLASEASTALTLVESFENPDSADFD